MSKEQAKRRANLLYQLRQKGIRCHTRQYTIFFPYGQDPDAVSEIFVVLEVNTILQYNMKFLKHERRNRFCFYG